MRRYTRPPMTTVSQSWREYVRPAVALKLTRLVTSVERFGRTSVTGLIRGYMDGHRLRGVGVVVGSLIDPEKLGNSHVRIHALEGQLFRRVIEDGAERSQLKYSIWRERDIYGVAAGSLGRPEATLRSTLTALGRAVDGSWRADLEHLTHTSGLSDHVHFLGRLDDRRRDEIYAQGHLFVLPSVKEGFGIVFLEAWRYRLPIVAGNEDASTEVIRHGVDGLCVSPRPEAVAGAVCTLLRDADLRRTMGAAGHERLRDKFTHERFRDALRQVLIVSRPCAD